MERLDFNMAKLALTFLLLMAMRDSSFAMTSSYFESNSTPIVLGFGFQYLHPEFQPIENVIIRNNKTTSDPAPVSGKVEQNYPDVFAQILDLKVRVHERTNATIRFHSFFPLNSFAQMDTGNTYLPEYVLYRVENQRPRLSTIAEFDIVENMRAGFGIDLGFGVTSEANVFLQSGAGKVSNQRVSATVKPRVVPILSFEVNDYLFVVRGENKVSFSLNSAAGASVFPPLSASFDVTYQSNSALYYDPWKFDLSRRHSLSLLGLESWHLGWGASYQLWSGYEARAAVISGISGTFSNGQAPQFKTRTLLVPRVSLEKRFERARWELEYQFKDSIFTDTPSGSGNYLDPPRHTAVLSAMLPLGEGMEWGASIQVARLSSQSVLKSDTTEIGAPGYTASGWLYGGSLNVTVPFQTKGL